MTEIIGTLSQILGEILGNPVNLVMETRREDVPNWSSFDYIEFIVAVESKFDMKFKLSEIESFENIGEIAKVVEQRR